MATRGRAGDIGFYNTVQMHRAPARAATRIIALAGGLVFAAALFAFLVAYVWWFDEPAEPGRSGRAIAADILLFTVFALHHSLFARTGFKQWLKGIVPPELERSVYVWIASVLFIAVCVWWQPVTGTLWRASDVARATLLALQGVAIVMTLAAARRLDVFDLAGVRQVMRPRDAEPRLDDSGLYRIVRHPIYAAWLLLVWCAPTMNGTRLVFAAISSLYLVLAVPFEERDLRRTFGAGYDAYQRRVRWRILPYVY
jgi:protein-S-isoprenylcysteine O-methyltransferase Ste14